MIEWDFFRYLFRGSQGPSFPGLETLRYDELPAEGLTMGTLYLGRQGVGKTSSLAQHVVDYAIRFPNRAIFSLDWSGSLTNTILRLILQQDKYTRDRLLMRLVCDELGHPDWVIPMPEFSKRYRSPYEEQVQRVAVNLSKLAPELVRDAPFLAGLGLREIAPQIFRLLTAILDDQGRPWQITEAKKIIVDEGLMKRALSLYGAQVPQAKWFLEKVFLELKKMEKELRTYALLALLGAIETESARARVGSNSPGWTPKEAIEKGLIVLVNGGPLINQRNTQHYLFTQVYSLIISEINKRIPGDPDDEPFALIMDEVYSLLSIPGMAEEVGMLAPLYRSRKLELYVVLQALSQLAPALRKQIWSLGNIVAFAISNFDEDYEIAQQLFSYESQAIKLEPRSENQLPILETDRGQYLKIANWIQKLSYRECIMRRYLSEREMDKYIRHVPRTRDHPEHEPEVEIDEVKERSLKERGIKIKDELRTINSRNISYEDLKRNKKPPTL